MRFCIITCPRFGNQMYCRKLKLEAEDYYLVSCHREENIDYPGQFKKLIGLLNYLVERYGKRCCCLNASSDS